MQRNSYILIVLSVIVLLSLVATSGMGAIHIGFSEWWQILLAKAGWVEEVPDAQKTAVLWVIRLPRVITSLLVGASLALCGAALQGLFRNPLADPSIIGISAGAAFSAALVIVLASSLLASGWWAGTLLSLVTFLGAVGSTFLVFALARQKHRTNVTMMLLAGIALNALASACTGVLIFVADDAQLRSITFWTLGSLGGANWTTVGLLALATGLATVFLFRLAKVFNALTLGEQEAKYIGMPIERLKVQVVILTALAIGTAVAFCGMIGFVGLVVPHVLRLIGGGNYRFLLPASVLAGALLLCWADTLARTVVAPAEIPIGVITALLGAPVFLIILYRQKNALN
ncbi:iron ABC transporter permease [uncultured Microscilla sp.]|uniref:FecCD family ABC transporter permease n=1 Tax=uncultured Microscilla sp. TaxID=432653 RepID=UPI0026141D02|nr:iron ABC transporter permease [uncultured Microscilla sp.]